MGAEIDRLELQVETQATKANNQLINWLESWSLCQILLSWFGITRSQGRNSRNKPYEKYNWCWNCHERKHKESTWIFLCSWIDAWTPYFRMFLYVRVPSNSPLATKEKSNGSASFLVYCGFICKIKSLPVCTFGKLYSSKKASKSQRKMLVSAINKPTLLSLRSILIFRMFVPTRWLVRWFILSIFRSLYIISEKSCQNGRKCDKIVWYNHKTNTYCMV